MTHPFLATMSTLLAERGIATLRYQFPYMEKGSRRPDPPKVAEATVRAVLGEAQRLAPGLPLFAGGKSFGGRMTSQAEASEHLPGVRGLAFLGFPLHPPGAPRSHAAITSPQSGSPMLFLQGTSDEFADLALLRRLVKRLGPNSTLHLIEKANHSFRVPAKTGRAPADINGGAHRHARRLDRPRPRADLVNWTPAGPFNINRDALRGRISASLAAASPGSSVGRAAD